jgi:kynurenine formamidase
MCLHGTVDSVRGQATREGGRRVDNRTLIAGYHFPGFGLDAAMWLVDRRDLTGIGVDTLSLDPGNSSTFPVHVNFLATDRYGLENLNNLDKSPRAARSPTSA